MESIIPALVGGGSTGICIAMLLYMYYKDKEVSRIISDYNRIIQEHFRRDVDARKEETFSRLEIAKALNKLAGDVSNCPTNVIGRLTKKKL